MNRDCLNKTNVEIVFLVICAMRMSSWIREPKTFSYFYGTNIYSPFLFKRQSVQSPLQEECLLVREMEVIKRFLNRTLYIALPARDNFENILEADCLLNKNRP